MLSLQPACTDAAVDALEKFAKTDAEAMSDLAAAYYTRAQRQDQPIDLLRSLDAAQHAVAAAPRSLNARFNRALALEAVGLESDAIAAWDEIAKSDESPWGNEARQHSERLQRARATSTAEQWNRIHTQLPALLRTHDRTTMARLIAPFPLKAEQVLEQELLGKWVTAPTEENLDAIKTLASVLGPLTKDRFVNDVVDSLDASPETLRAISALLSARTDAEIANAEALLERIHSPLSLIARFKALRVQVLLDETAVTALDALERSALAHGYRHFIGPIHTLRALALTQLGRYLDAVAYSDTAFAAYMRIGDQEHAIGVRAREIGLLMLAGAGVPAWREAMETIRYIDHLGEADDWHALLNDTAKTALLLGYPDIALLFQNAAIRVLQQQLVSIPPERIDVISHVQLHLGSALRDRVDIEIQRGDYDDAERDLDEAARLTEEKTDPNPNLRRELQARADETRGKALVHTDPLRAAAAFSSAFELRRENYPTLKAAILVERAGAWRAAGRSVDAENDLKAAIELLRGEETEVLEHRQRGSGEDLWRDYFSRFQETYRLLIGQLIHEGRSAEALTYAEQARAREVLNLAIQPRAAAGDLRLDTLQSKLPPGTVILEYALLDDQAITWVISRDQFEIVRQNVRRSDIERRGAALQSAARARNASNLETQLNALYDVLVAIPLRAIRPAPSRLVFIPDGAMHGIPLNALRNSTTGRFLIQDFPVETAGSAQLYLVSLQRDADIPRTPNFQVLLMGDPAFDASFKLAQGLTSLPGARAEVRSIEPLYAPHTRVRIGADATIPELLALARDSALVHLAAHAVANAQSPWRSFIALAPSPGDNGALEASELLTKLKLGRTRLFILSACSSAGGIPVGPEGVAPLVRPLIAAGVPAVIGSLWNVQDATAEELLVSFHRHYRDGNDAAVALQQAQLDLLKAKNPGLRSALSWAPFQVIGHASSPFAPAQRNTKEKPP